MITLPPALAVALSLVTAEVAPEVMAGRHPLIRGALVGNHALVFGLIDRPGPLPGGGYGRPERTRLELARTGPRGGCVAILRAALSGAQPELIDLCGDNGGGMRWPTRPGPVPLRWHLSSGVLYYASCTTDENTFRGLKPPPVGRLEGPNGYIRRVSLAAPVLAAGRVGPGVDGRDQLTARTAVLRNASQELVPLGPVEERFGPVFLPRRPPPPRRPEPELWRTHYDFHMTGPPDLGPNFEITLGGAPDFELYVSIPSGLVRHHMTLRPEFGSGRLGWGMVSAHPAAWVGPFYVVADGADRHFVVPGGRVFTLPADALPGSALVKTWDDGLILALVHDADSGRSYAFTRTHSFHITSKPDPKPHAIKAFPGATAEEALDTVARCGRVIRGLK